MNNFDVSALVKAVERMATALEGIEASLDRISDTLDAELNTIEEPKEEMVKIYNGVGCNSCEPQGRG